MSVISELIRLGLSVAVMSLWSRAPYSAAVNSPSGEESPGHGKPLNKTNARIQIVRHAMRESMPEPAGVAAANPVWSSSVEDLTLPCVRAHRNKPARKQLCSMVQPGTVRRKVTRQKL